MDLFVSCQLPYYVSWRPDLGAIAYDAFSLDWTHLKGPLERDRQSPVSSKSTKGSDGPCNPTVESTAMVSSTPEHDNTNLDPPAEQVRSLLTDTSVQRIRYLPMSSRMDYLIQKQKNFRRPFKTLIGLMETKSSKSYDSLFTKWGKLV